jgi:hypothetical protein
MEDFKKMRKRHICMRTYVGPLLSEYETRHCLIITQLKSAGFQSLSIDGTLLANDDQCKRKAIGEFCGLTPPQIGHSRPVSNYGLG